MATVLPPSAFFSDGPINLKPIRRSRICTRPTSLRSPKPHLISSSSMVPKTSNWFFCHKIQFWNSSGAFHRVISLPRLKVSSEDAQFNSIPEDKQVQQRQYPNFAEFITSERVKVVAMLALALAFCNADRVVMSVAIVPLSLANGWSRSFSGIVQEYKKHIL